MSSKIDTLLKTSPLELKKTSSLLKLNNLGQSSKYDDILDISTPKRKTMGKMMNYKNPKNKDETKQLLRLRHISSIVTEKSQPDESDAFTKVYLYQQEYPIEVKEHSVFMDSRGLKIPQLQHYLQKDYTFDTVSRDGQTLLQHVIKFDNIPVFDYILDLGHPANTQDNKGKTALHSAVLFDSIYFVKRLLKKGADINLADDEGKTPIFGLGKTGTIVIPFIKDHVDTVRRDKLNNSVLTKHIELNDVPMVTTLLDKLGVDPNLKNDKGVPDFFGSRSPEMLQLFISKGVDITTRIFKRGWTLLHTVVRLGDLKMIEYLVKNKLFDVNVKSRDNETPLHVASQFGLSTVVEMLISLGAEVNALTDTLQTALLLALRNDKRKTLKILANNGGDIGKEELDQLILEKAETETKELDQFILKKAETETN